MTKNRVGLVFQTLLKRNFSSSKPNVLDPLQEAALSEKCIVVDENDQRIGSATKYDCHRVQKDGNLPLHRAFSVFLFNSLGDILLQQRAASKVTFPLYVSNTCCSHPIEDYPEELIEENAQGIKLAAIRRLNYELGIPKDELNPVDFNYLTRIHYKSTDTGIWGEHEIDYILFLQKDITIKPNQNEVEFVKYVKKEHFAEYLKTLNDPITPWFKLICNSRLLPWWNNLSNLEQFKDHKNIERF